MRFSSARPPSAAFLLLAGFIGWSAAFVLLYSVLSFGCAYGWDAMALGPVSLNRALLLGAWALSIAGLGAVLFATLRMFKAEGKGAGAFLRSAGIALSALAFGATLWNFFMVATLSTCL